MDMKYIEEIMEDSYYEKFMTESNAIEGETGLNPNDIEAVRFVVSGGIKTEKRLLKLHKILTKHLKVDWSGKYRNCDVWVGGHATPSPESIPCHMDGLFDRLPNLRAWETHNIFEAIHPFQDFNGRTGRLLWLSKALKQYRNPFALPFLHKYYYETLEYWTGARMGKKDNGDLGLA